MFMFLSLQRPSHIVSILFVFIFFWSNVTESRITTEVIYRFPLITLTDKQIKIDHRIEVIK